MQGNSSVIATIVIGVIIVGAVAYGIYSTNSGLSSLSQQNTSLKGQIAGLGQQISTINEQESALSSQNSNLVDQVSELDQQNVGLNQQLSSLSQQVSVLEQRTLSVVTMTNTFVSVQTTSVTTTMTVTSISAVPQSTLVIIGDAYNSTTYTFTFQVQNTQDYTVYAQVSGKIWGQATSGCMGVGQAGLYISQIYTFTPSSTTVVKMDLTLSQWTGYCGTNPITTAYVTLILPDTTAVSPTYTFNIVPNYNHP